MIFWLGALVLQSLLGVTAKERTEEASGRNSRRKWKTCFNSMLVTNISFNPETYSGLPARYTNTIVAYVF